jgi:hypothetical protein
MKREQLAAAVGFMNSSSGIRSLKNNIKEICFILKKLLLFY